MLLLSFSDQELRDRKHFLTSDDRRGSQLSNDVSGPLPLRSLVPNSRFLSSYVLFHFIHLSSPWFRPSFSSFANESLLVVRHRTQGEGRAEIGHCGQMVRRRMMRDSNLVWIRPSTYNIRCPFCPACCLLTEWDQSTTKIQRWVDQWWHEVKKRILTECH